MLVYMIKIWSQFASWEVTIIYEFNENIQIYIFLFILTQSFSFW